MTQQVDDRVHNRGLAWGLDLTHPEVTTPEEIAEFRRISGNQLGMQQDGLDFWLDEQPEVLKRYRAWADKLRIRQADESPNKWSANGVGIMYVYAMTGFEDGLRYGIQGANRRMTKAQCLEQFALVFRYGGPRAMAALARAARDHQWHAPEEPVVWPGGWAPDPEAFHSGADFSSPTTTASDTRKIVEWYERWLGEVPRQIRFLAKHRPELLKAFRSRYENTLRVLPKQTEPHVLIQISMTRRAGDGIREGVLLARGFGMTKDQVMEAIDWGTFYGGTDAMGLVEETAGDVLDNWPS
jgi:hypothetical protein